MIEYIFFLLVAFQFKHFICDFPLQNKYMLGKFNKVGWLMPLTAHVAVQAAGTLLISLVALTLFGHSLAFVLAAVIGLAVLDFVIHFTMDHIKASPTMLGRFGITEKYFWWSLGFDQMVHHLTHYLIIAILIFL